MTWFTMDISGFQPKQLKNEGRYQRTCYVWYDNDDHKLEPLFYIVLGDRAGSVKRKTPEATPNELKENNKLIESEKAETGGVNIQ